MGCRSWGRRVSVAEHGPNVFDADHSAGRFSWATASHWATLPKPTVGWTWNDLLERSIALSDPDRGQYGYAYQGSGGNSLGETMLMMYQWGGGLFDDLQAINGRSFSCQMP